MCQRFMGIECGVMPGTLRRWNVGADRSDVSTVDARQLDIERTANRMSRRYARQTAVPMSTHVVVRIRPRRLALDPLDGRANAPGMR
jgi:hypothetical protein